MSQITAYSDLYPELTLALPGCASGVMLSGLQRAGRIFARETLAYRPDLDPLPVTNWQREYDLGKGEAHNHDAHIHRLYSVAINQCPILPRYYDLRESRWLQLHSEALPQALDVERLLTCGTSPKTEYTDWTGITDGSVTFGVNSSTYEATDLDFSAAATMDDVALIIETGWRDAQDYADNFVKWADAGTSKFLLWTYSGELTYLTAGTSGTDISGALHLNGLEGGTGVSIDPVLEVTAALMPDMRALAFTSDFLDRWGETIAAKAIEIIAGYRGSAQVPNPYYNPDLAAQNRIEYRRGKQQAIVNIGKADKDVLEPIL